MCLSVCYSVNSFKFEKFEVIEFTAILWVSHCMYSSKCTVITKNDVLHKVTFCKSHAMSLYPHFFDSLPPPPNALLHFHPSQPPSTLHWHLPSPPYLLAPPNCFIFIFSDLFRITYMIIHKDIADSAVSEGHFNL